MGWFLEVFCVCYEMRRRAPGILRTELNYDYRLVVGFDDDGGGMDR